MNYSLKIFIFLIVYIMISFFVFIEYKFEDMTSDSKNFLIKKELSKDSIKIFDGYISPNYFIIPYKDKYIYKKINFTDLAFVLFIFFLNVILLLILIVTIRKAEKERKLFIETDVESRASNNSLTILAENIHHELNTPLKIIERKYNVFKKRFIYCMTSKNLDEPVDTLEEFKDKIKKDSILINDRVYEKNEVFEMFEMFEESIEQIRAVLNNMRDFKSLRYSNGNKTIYELAEGTMKIIKIVTDFEYSFKIDEKLKNYKINHSTGLKNADLLNVFINHLKNSLDANSLFIELKVDKVANNKLHLLFIDNGNGIPKEIVKNIFKPNVSSKSPDMVGLRGNGLYLNKQILKIAGGDILLKETSSNGTTFEIIIPIESN